jgi:predicted enzyme related to lactoylglutathione lyase
MREELKQHGAFSWFELLTTDVSASKDFYGKVFGWKLENHPMGEGDYFVVENDDEQVAGIMKKPEKAAAVPPYWSVYVAVDDVDAVADKATENGGTLVVPPRDIPTIGRFCTFTDPQGAYISAITYRTD